MILIKNGTLIDPANNLEGEYDVLVDGAAVRAIDRPGSLPAENAEVIDARGCWVTPGLIDVHVHLREPGFEWKETVATGSRAAAQGGFTTIFCMANTRPVNDNAEITRFILEQAAQVKNGARVLPMGAVSKGLEGKDLAPLSELKKAGAIAFSDDGKPVTDASLMRRALEWSRMLDTRVCCHEEENALCACGSMNESAMSLRLGLKGMPKAGEEIMVARDIELARAFGGKVHFCHLSSARSVELVRRAKNDGIPVSAEVTPHHLALTEQAIGNYDTNAKMNPPLREQGDLEALLKGLADGTIDAVASDHAPHEKDTKEVEFDKAAFGIIGLQTSLPLLLGFVAKGRLGRRRLIEAWTSGPAKAFGLTGAGSLKAGQPADITIIDPEKRYTLDAGLIRSISKNTPFLGRELTGAARAVLKGGKVIVREDRLEDA